MEHQTDENTEFTTTIQGEDLSWIEDLEANQITETDEAIDHMVESITNVTAYQMGRDAFAAAESSSTAGISGLTGIQRIIFHAGYIDAKEGHSVHAPDGWIATDVDVCDLPF